MSPISKNPKEGEVKISKTIKFQVEYEPEEIPENLRQEVEERILYATTWFWFGAHEPDQVPEEVRVEVVVEATEDVEDWNWIEEFAIPFDRYPSWQGKKFTEPRKYIVVYCHWDHEAPSRISRDPVFGTLDHWI